MSLLLQAIHPPAGRASLAEVVLKEIKALDKAAKGKQLAVMRLINHQHVIQLPNLLQMNPAGNIDGHRLPMDITD